MPSLTEKLKLLGVKIGGRDLPTAQPRHPIEKDILASLTHVLQGRPYPTLFGETFIVEKDYPPQYCHGEASLYRPTSLNILSAWAGEPRLMNLDPQSFVYLDTETTGLSGGTGTYTFLIGLGRFEGDRFHLIQIFMHDPLFEPAQLAAVEEFLAPCQAIVTFNGKAFDVPLLTTRFQLQGVRSPLTDLAHVDLLPLARRLWRDRLPSRTLGNLEVQILGAIRSNEDIPGWLIPQIYFDYLRDKDPQPLKNVIYHNAMDVLSLAALFHHIAALLEEPFSLGSRYGVDLIALAKLYEDLGEIETATRLYIHGLNHEDALEERLPREVLLNAIQRLAAIHKHQENLDAAVELWKQGARHQHLHSHIELAKFYEHWEKDYAEALVWTQSAMDLLLSPDTPWLERVRWLPELEHRRTRLRRKLNEPFSPQDI